MVKSSPFRIDFNDDIWKNFYRSVKNVKSQEEQNNTNEGILDNIRMLQYQIDDLTTTIRTLDDKLKRMEEPTCIKEDSKEIDIFKPGTVVYHNEYGAGMVTERCYMDFPVSSTLISLDFVSGIQMEMSIDDRRLKDFTFDVNASDAVKEDICIKLKMLEERRKRINE